ncbi:iron-sulfur cluster assembly scaffold protein [Mycoplasmopsis edwardii]|nr:iron-sulfur cluster assembly scaffold protein [Mycoplasmopsis edwardii]
MRFNPNEAREIIMNHYMKPDNKEALKDDFITSFSNTCSDKLDLALSFDNDVLKDAKFNGHGCSVFLASTDILLNILKGKSKSEINELLVLYERFLNEEQLSDEEINSLGELWVFFNVKKHLSRMACALLTSKTIINEIK